MPKYEVFFNQDNLLEVVDPNGGHNPLSKEDTGVFLFTTLRRKDFAQVAAGVAPEGVRLAVERVADTLGRLIEGDIPTVSEKTGGMLEALLQAAGIRPVRDPDKGYVPNVELLIPAVFSAAQIARSYKVESAAADADADTLTQQGHYLLLSERFLNALQMCAERVLRNRAPVARAAGETVRNVNSAVGAFLYKNSELSQLAEAPQRFVHEAAERGQETKEALAKAEERLRVQLTEEIYAKAYADGRNAVLAQIGDKLGKIDLPEAPALPGPQGPGTTRATRR